MSDDDEKHGSCLCGAVTFTLNGPLRSSVACHCRGCRKTSGHYWSATEVARKGLFITNETGLRWFDSSPQTRRGFCQFCGSSLFWDWHDKDTVSVGSGTLDGETGLSTLRHTCCAEKGDYYEIEEGPVKFGSY